MRAVAAYTGANCGSCGELLSLSPSHVVLPIRFAQRPIIMREFHAFLSGFLTVVLLARYPTCQCEKDSALLFADGCPIFSLLGEHDMPR